MSSRPYGRRRLVALLCAAVLTAAVVGIVVVAVSGSGSHMPHYVPAGGRAVAVPRGVAPGLQVPAGPAWHPAPTAVRAAKRLRLAVRVAQLFLVPVSGPSPPAAAALAGSGWGGVVLGRDNYVSARRLPALTGAVRTALAAGSGGTIKPLIAASQDGGPGTAFPGLPPLGEAAVSAGGNVPAAAGAQAALAAARLRSLGVTMTLAPMADVDIPTGALTGRLFGTDASTVAQFTSQAVTGYARGRLIAAVSHFPGEGSASVDPDQQAATVGGTLSNLRANDLIPFAAVAARAPVVEMSNAAYAAFDGVTPADLLPAAVGLLRDELHFQGVVMSGDLDATLQPTGAGPGTVALRALQAGDDLLYIHGPTKELQAAYGGVLAAARHSAAVRSLVDQALIRDLTLKVRYGLLTG